MYITPRIVFLTMNNIKIYFISQTLNYKSCNITKVLLISWQIKQIRKNELIIVTCNLRHEAFIVT